MGAYKAGLTYRTRGEFAQLTDETAKKKKKPAAAAVAVATAPLLLPPPCRRVTNVIITIISLLLLAELLLAIHKCRQFSQCSVGERRSKKTDKDSLKSSSSSTFTQAIKRLHRNSLHCLSSRCDRFTIRA